MATKLTKRACEAAAATGSGWSVVWDSEIRGFGLRVRGAGTRAFVVFYRTRDGRKRLHTVGRFPEMTVDQARQEARRLLVDAMQGGDPAGERQRVRRSPTIAQLAEVYLDGYARPRKRTWKDDAQRIRDYLIPEWGGRKAESIRRADVSALHRKIGERSGQYAANRALALISHMLGWAERQGMLPEGHPNPARGVERFRERSRDRWLSPDEVRKVVSAVEAEPNPYVRAYFWLSLMTGCRKCELLFARWVDVDLERGVLRLPETKNGRSHEVPLAGHAQQVLQALPRRAGSPYVFAGRAPGSVLSVAAIDKAWRRIRAAAGAKDARLHDLRRTVGSWLAQSGVSLHLIGHLLNHKSPTVTNVYARFANDSARAALEHHATAVLAAVGLGAAEDGQRGKAGQVW